MIARGKKIYLCRPDRSIITELNGIQTDTVSYSTHVKDYDELTFTVDEYIVVNGEKVKSSGYDLLDVYLNLYLEDIGYFQMQHPSTSNDGTKETKSINAYSLEKEWEQHDWQGLKVNTGDEDSLEQLAADNLNELGLAKEFVVFYRPDKTDLSLIHLMLEKMPGWSVSDEDIDPLLWNRKMRIDENNINMYALATSVIAPRLECIISFDTITKHIKAISKARLNDYTYNTNIFIGYRNLANAVDISVNEDSVYTRFSCQGDDDLDFRDINYGDNHVYNYSYFMRTPYMRAAENYITDEGLNPLLDEWDNNLTEVEGIIPKLEYWMSWRDENRNDFITLSKSRANVNDLIYDIQYKVPNDGDDWSQWDSMAEDLLLQNQRYYNAQLTLLQVSVDDDPQYDSEGNYIPWKKQDGTVNHELYMEKLYNLENWFGGYFTYYEIITYILPNIQTAIDNLGQPEKKDYNKEYLTDWELYGIKELEAKQKEYNEELISLAKYSKPWSQMTAEEKAAFGNDEDIYSADQISESELEKMAVQARKIYMERNGLEKDSWAEYEYRPQSEKNANQAAGLHALYKLHFMKNVKAERRVESELFDLEESRRVFDTLVSSDEKERIANWEHIRWQAYMRTEGFVHAPYEKTKELYDSLYMGDAKATAALTRAALRKARIHPTIGDNENHLPKISRLLGDPNDPEFFHKNDLRFVNSIPDLISAYYKIVSAEGHQKA